MDFWASLEHSLHYKAQSEIPGFIVDELKNCADVIASTDARMQAIHKAVNLLRDVTRRIDLPKRMKRPSSRRGRRPRLSKKF